MKKKLFFVMLINILGFSFAQEKDSVPIDLIADSGSYDQATGLAVYEGNVKVTQGVAAIWADKLTILLKDNAADRIEAESNKGKLVKFEYKGEKQPIKGQAKKAVYDIPVKKVSLIGQAKITQAKDVVTGEKLTYDLAKEIIKGSRVQMKFLPSKKK